MISILCMNIKSKRTGNRELHLKTLNKMLPYFAAFERHFYVKPAYLYFHPMIELKVSHPQGYKNFSTDGLHVFRRTDKLWGGLSSDLL